MPLHTPLLLPSLYIGLFPYITSIFVFIPRKVALETQRTTGTWILLPSKTEYIQHMGQGQCYLRQDCPQVKLSSGKTVLR